MDGFSCSRVVELKRVAFTHVKPVERRIPARMVETVEKTEGSADIIATTASILYYEEDLLRMASTP